MGYTAEIMTPGLAGPLRCLMLLVHSLFSYWSYEEAIYTLEQVALQMFCENINRSAFRPHKTMLVGP